jgi:hypothetical protein
MVLPFQIEMALAFAHFGQSPGHAREVDVLSAEPVGNIEGGDEQAFAVLMDQVHL